MKNKVITYDVIQITEQEIVDKSIKDIEDMIKFKSNLAGRAILNRLKKYTIK